jgi:hypothetical protein
MKKIYQNPTLTIVNVQTTQMIAASEQRGFGGNVTTATGAESRRNTLWDDEEED